MLPVRDSSSKGAFAVVAHGLFGWALCAATMGVSLKVFSLGIALTIHASVAPVLFTIVSLVYFNRPDAWPPLRTAIAFLACVVVMDVLVVALVVERSFAMFGSIPGTWLPFILIFLATWLTGLAVRGKSRRLPA
jgi:hypothetical protein